MSKRKYIKQKGKIAIKDPVSGHRFWLNMKTETVMPTHWKKQCYILQKGLKGVSDEN